MDAQPQLPVPWLDPKTIPFHVRLGNRNETSTPKITPYGLVPSTQSAVLNLIGEHLNLIDPMGAAFIILDGDEIILDGLDMKNVVLRNVNVRYYGSRVIMQNVYFVNCRFTFLPASQMSDVLKRLLKEHNIPFGEPATPFQLNKELLAGKILESPSVTFTAS